MRRCVELRTRRVGPVALTCAVLALTVPVTARQGTDRSGGSPPPTIAIVAFTNITGDPADDWIGAGIAESLVTGIPGTYAVISRARVSNAPDEGGGASANDQAQEVGRRLGARFVVSGAYQRLGEKIRITGLFVDVSTGNVVRSAKIDGALDDLFSLQDRVVEELSGPFLRAEAGPPSPQGDRNRGGPGTHTTVCRSRSAGGRGAASGVGPAGPLDARHRGQCGVLGWRGRATRHDRRSTAAYRPRGCDPG